VDFSFKNTITYITDYEFFKHILQIMNFFNIEQQLNVEQSYNSKKSLIDKVFIFQHRK